MRSEPSIEARLRELHAPRIEPSPAPDQPDQPDQRASADAREAEALAAWSQRYATPAREPDPGEHGLLGVFGMLARHRLAVALAVMLVAIVGACVLPTSYEVPLGTSVEIRMLGGELSSAQSIAKYVQARSNASEVDVLMREIAVDGSGSQFVMMIRLWDHELALGEIEHELREQFPELEHAKIIETPLEGEIETIWARRLANRAFSLSLREVDVEQARAQLLLELQARGFEEDEIVVKVRDRASGEREVEVQIERRGFQGDADGDSALMDPLGPGFHWVMDPSSPEHVVLPAPPHGAAVRVDVRGDEPE
ncbi:hypothetical protein [Enhygromyxa salina]|uniref:Uncharacterized protein n=1 Tax=Enhygromyxa salina TaxID=215803 RepID=A0A2S9YYU0_9BACT|nr:hypothetical protein [Enhygromyxa salina]PRQ10258.1 hypothetical protein ENSA7_00670 [Enhygromyxa salina]